MASRFFTPREVGRLAALSRSYHEALPDIVAAVVQELREETGPQWREDVAAYFGMPPIEVSRLAGVRAVHYGFVHRGGLSSETQVYTRILQEIGDGRLRSGDQLPPRTRFTEMYNCDKKTHSGVVSRLIRSGVVHRPGGGGGPLYVL